MIWLTTAAAYAAAPCAVNTVGAVAEAVDAVNDAYRHVDQVAFDRATVDLTAALACLDEVVSDDLVVHVHKAMGLASFVSGRTKACVQSLAAARRLDPSWELDSQDFAWGHPYRDLWDSAIDGGRFQALGNIPPDVWFVDGQETVEVPLERAFLLQVVHKDALVWTGYLWGIGDLPIRGQELPETTFEGRSLSVALMAVGRAIKVTQAAQAESGWDNLEATAMGAGIAGLVRITPGANVGAEIAGSGVSPKDPVLAGGLGPEASAVLLAGAVLPSQHGRLRVSGRIGGAVGSLTSWPRSSEGLVARSLTIVSASVGGEVTYETDRLNLGVAAEYLLASGVVPYQLHTRLVTARALTDHLALQGIVTLRSGGLPFVDAAGAPIGRRDDLDVRAGLGLALWLP